MPVFLAMRAEERAKIRAECERRWRDAGATSARHRRDHDVGAIPARRRRDTGATPALLCAHRKKHRHYVSRPPYRVPFRALLRAVAPVSRRRRTGVAPTLGRCCADVAPVSHRCRADVVVAPVSRRRRSNSARIFARSSARIARNTGISFLGHHSRTGVAPTSWSRRCRAVTALHCMT